MKKCTKCLTFKSLDHFYPDKGQTSGLRPDCKACCGVRRKRQYDLLKQDLEKFKTVTRKSHLKREYNLTTENYQILFEKQKGKCQICRTHQSDLKKTLCVDHDHITGEIRGLLCDPCNRGIGAFRDSISNLYNAIDYLRQV